MRSAHRSVGRRVTLPLAAVVCALVAGAVAQAASASASAQPAQRTQAPAAGAHAFAGTFTCADTDLARRRSLNAGVSDHAS